MIAALKSMLPALVVVIAGDDAQVYMCDLVPILGAQFGEVAKCFWSSESEVVGLPKVSSAFCMKSPASGQKMYRNLIATRLFLFRKMLMRQLG